VRHRFIGPGRRGWEFRAPNAISQFERGAPGLGCVGDPGGTFGLVFGVSEGEGLDGGAVGDSGGRGVTDGEAGVGGACCAQPSVIALTAIRVRAEAFIVMVLILYLYVVSKARAHGVIGH
jgi:hypothetical protein